MKIIMVSEKGISKNRNEDVFYKRETESGFCFVGIADGQSAKQRCTEGAKAALVAVADCLQKYSMSGDAFDFHDRIRFEVADTIKKNIRMLAEVFDTNEEQFSSTIVCIAFNRHTDFLVTIHLGDGLIASVNERSAMRILSYPENGITRSHTWLTTNQAMNSHIRVGSGSLSLHKGILLVTDGAYKAFDILKRKYYSSEDEEIFNENTISQVLQETEPEDDATMLFVEI